MTASKISQYRGIIVSAPSSRAGKTTVALGLMRALTGRGLAVQAYKSGPDYIDTAFHSKVTRRQSVNLDAWAMHEAMIRRLIAIESRDADISIIEGAMGLFDGALANGQYATGATADLAALTGWPVILVLDVARQAATAAAIVKGCATYRNDVRICAVILNNVASERHENLIKGPIEALGIPVVASIKRRHDLSLPERHLGLVQACENEHLEKVLDSCAGIVGTGKRVDAIAQLAQPAHFQTSNATASPRPHADQSKPREGFPPGKKIALARDEAFSFIYSHMIDQWISHGAQVLPFSPLANEPPSQDADAVWLPGGYPELHARELAAADRFHAGMHATSAKGVPIHGECGGYMVLGEGLTDANGDRHTMLALLGLETSFSQRKLTLGYRRSRLISDCILGHAGQTIFGHEFHYATILKNDDPPLAEVYDAQDAPIAGSGSRRDNVTGSFFHMIDRLQQCQ